eukprot:TRINITY_DN17547_c0_g1_i1.p2 TRINITY_DN17547_c0_g1~~TRINITY_DN17547_c0_g1_i1.p2  ORF type:complete len:233 (+),score=43.26 TRINITY_DN17547_c0_g1_i1:53-751(+)
MCSPLRPLLTLAAVACLAAVVAGLGPKLSPQFTATVVVNTSYPQQHSYPQTLYNDFLHARSATTNVDQKPTDDGSMSVSFCGGNSTWFTANEWNTHECEFGCKDGHSCETEHGGCSCVVSYVWQTLMLADEAGPCFSGVVEGTLYSHADANNTFIQNYCIGSDNTPLYVELTFPDQPEIWTMIVFQTWDPTDPDDSVFDVPDSCSCQYAETKPRTGAAVRPRTLQQLLQWDQ